MGLGHSPRIVTDGMVLYLDAANPKNYNLREVEVLVVAGGGGGGSWHGGGGGGGGLIYSSAVSVTPGSAATVTVGAGGTGGGNTNAGTSPNGGGNGGNSVFGSLTAIGGGGGGSYPNNGSSGGSGGAGSNWSGGATGGSATSGQGFAGGSNSGVGQDNYGGGGGGAGGTAKGLSNNSGGDGLPYNISGTQTYYSGGGGAGVYPGYTNGTSYGYGGLGGGGNGGDGPHGGGTTPGNGSSNTGGGGGGVADLSKIGGSGGSGIVIVRYQGPQKAIGGTITSNNGYTIHTFTTSSTFTPLVNTNGSAVLGLSDFSGRGNFGTTVNSPTYSSANGGYIYFDGTDEYATVPPNSGWAFGENGTVEQWVYVAGNNGGNDRFWCVNNNSSGLDAYLNGASYNIGFHGGVVLTTTTISQNTWVHFVVTYTSGTIKVYFNTVEQGLSGTTTGYNITNNGTLYIGRYIVAPYELNGRISSMKIYNRALTAAEITQNFNALRSRFSI